MRKKWAYKDTPPSKQASSLSKAVNISLPLAIVLLQRGIVDFESAKKFFRPQLHELHDPFLMTGMSDSVTRLKSAMDKQEKILIYGDYDVDGTTAVSLVYSYLKSFYSHCDFYIPDRHTEGYGVSISSIQWAEENGFTLIIALDLGIKAMEAVALASSKKIDFIICDHHLPDANLPAAVAVLDPKRKDCTYPFKELSGCGLGFKLIQAFAQKYRNPEEAYHYLDLVAVSIASDIVPIVGENRILAYYGLQKLNLAPLPGLKALKELSGIKTEIDISGIVFALGPRINAAGRIAHARAAVQLLISQTEQEAMDMAEKINLKNKTRKELDLTVTEEALAMIESEENQRQRKTTVLYKSSWHKGIIGIVASRCIEKYYRPTIILTQSDDQKIVGSARSVADFDLHQALCQCSDLLEKFGGHQFAAGLTLTLANLAPFTKRFEEVVANSLTEEMQIPTLEIDTALHFDTINFKFSNVLKQLAPYGPQNQKPVFEATHVFIKDSLSCFKDKHIRFLAGQQGAQNTFIAIGFDLKDYYTQLVSASSFRMAFTLEENTFNGKTSLQLHIKDLMFN